MKFIIGKIKNAFDNDLDNDLDGYYSNMKIELSGIIYDLYDIYLFEFLRVIDKVIHNDDGEPGKYWDNEDYGTRYFDDDLPYIKIEHQDMFFAFKIRWIKEPLLIGQNDFLDAYIELKNTIMQKCNRLISI